MSFDVYIIHNAYLITYQHLVDWIQNRPKCDIKEYFGIISEQLPHAPPTGTTGNGIQLTWLMSAHKSPFDGDNVPWIERLKLTFTWWESILVL